MSEKFRILPASYLVLIEDEKILMLRRFNTGYEDGNYSLVAGKLDGKETFRQAIIREEEAGIIINQDDLQVVHVMDRQEFFNDIGARERLDIFIKANKWQGTPKNMEPNKCNDLDWFSFNNIPKNTIPYIQHALKCIGNNEFYSEFGF